MRIGVRSELQRCHSQRGSRLRRRVSPKSCLFSLHLPLLERFLPGCATSVDSASEAHTVVPQPQPCGRPKHLAVPCPHDVGAKLSPLQRGQSPTVCSIFIHQSRDQNTLMVSFPTDCYIVFVSLLLQKQTIDCAQYDGKEWSTSLTNDC